ncbi:MAG: EFR1 family ferrodoxin [Candidatus Helarchaeota archaeon]
MKSVIFYFSQVVTGNTKKIAESIAEGLRTNNNTCDLIRLHKLKNDLQMIKKFNFGDYDLIGIGVPVYYFHPPYSVYLTLKEFPSLINKKGFLFCTSGGNPGTTLYQMKIVLKEKGLIVIDGYDRWKGWDVHQMYRNFGGWLPKSFGHPTNDELEHAKQFGKSLISKTMDSNVNEKTDFWKKENESSKMWTYEYMQIWFPKLPEKFHKDKCTQCGYCAEICPMDKIILDPYPKFLDIPCNRCYICELKCPEKAIECEWDVQIAYLENLMKKRKKN